MAEKPHFSIIDSKGHNFIFICNVGVEESIFRFSVYKCCVCKVCINHYIYESIAYLEYPKIKSIDYLSCDEMIIKNIIE